MRWQGGANSWLQAFGNNIPSAVDICRRVVTCAVRYMADTDESLGDNGCKRHAVNSSPASELSDSGAAFMSLSGMHRLTIAL